MQRHLCLSLLFALGATSFSAPIAQAADTQGATDLSVVVGAALSTPVAIADRSTQQLYERVRVLEKLTSDVKRRTHEQKTETMIREMKEAREKGGQFDSAAFFARDPEREPTSDEVEIRELIQTLERRGTGHDLTAYASALGVKPAQRSGVDALAAFYAAMLAQEAATRQGSPDERSRLYQKAVSFWKLSGDAGEPGAYWNLAVMYLNGVGVMQSKLAAIEWNYKAGVGFLKLGEREKAQAALEAIQAIDKASPLGRKLEASLALGAPK